MPSPPTTRPPPDSSASATLRATLAGLGISLDQESTASLDELLQAATSVIHGLAQQADNARAQRDLLGGADNTRFWLWDIPRQSIRIEAAASARGASRPHEFSAWRQLSHPGDQAALDGIERFLQSDASQWRTTLRLRSSDGQWLPSHWLARVTRRDADGRISHLAGILDSTLKAADSAIIERLEAANRAKTDFLANISHEIRTPMTAIVGAAGLSCSSAGSPEQRELARTIKTSAEALLAILDQTLDYASIEIGGVTLEPGEFQPAALITETVRIFALAASHKNVDCSLRIAPDVPATLIADPVRLRQILSNLLNNAVKFTAQGSISINVEAQREAAQRCRLRLTVRDSGIGIPPEKQQLVFQMFSQADASTKRRYGGTGIGLSICQRLAEAMGGGISLHSQVNCGSSFQVNIECTLPASDEPAPHLLAGQQTLILDRSGERYALLAEQIEHLGGTTVHAASAEQAQQALNAANQAPFSLIFIDSESCPGAAHAQAARWARHAPLIFIRPLSAAGEAGQNPLPGRSPSLSPSLSLFRPYSTLDLQACVRSLETHSGKAGALNPPDLDGLDAATAPPGRNSRVKNLRVLLAEDNPVSRQVLSVILQRAGIDVLAVGNGAEALAAFEQKTNGFDLVLMDIQMPVMDGFEAAEAIRACEERRTWVAPPADSPDAATTWRNTPILALTADALGDIRERCRDAGMNEVLLKPATPERLLEAVRRLGATAAPAAPADDRNARIKAIRQLAARQDPACIDLEVALTWAGNDLAQLAMLIDSFLDDQPAFIADMDRLLGQDAFAEAAQRLHRHKSALGILGAKECTRLAEALTAACLRKNAAGQPLWLTLRKNSLRFAAVLHEVAAEIARNAETLDMA